MMLLPGRPYPLGATADEAGVNFAVHAGQATAVDLCLFDATGQETRHPMAVASDGVWHAYLRGAKPGQLYGFRAHGPYAPERGHRYNPHKLLLDPYAREIVGDFSWRPEHFGFELGHPDGARSFSTTDNAATALKARVAPPLASFAPVPPLGRPVAAVDRVIQELHVKGATQLHPAVPESLRGTYAGLAHPAVIAHLQALGVTTLCLLPIHYRLSEPQLAARGLTNYWGYNTLGYFMPDPRLAAAVDPSEVVQEFRAMVAALHAAGIEVVLDVVFNHTAEGDETGPTLSWRGLDHAGYYRLHADDPSRCENLTGCGNTLHCGRPRVVQLVLDALRYAVTLFGVDGFRFDLAPVLGRADAPFSATSPLLTALLQDPVLAGVTLIAEPWDLGAGGYQLGHFPARFLEWNDRFRDTLRRYWLHHDIGRGEFARRLMASSDVFHHEHRAPTSSVNFITAHDGFTLADLTAYATKRNHANGEHNRDGRDTNWSHPCGPEGASTDPAVRHRRAALRRALLATTLLAQGTPMLLAGDELSHTQGGNNNAYCQDNAVTWLHWQPAADQDHRPLIATLTALRRRFPALRSGRWHSGGAILPNGRRDLVWLHPAGHEMTLEDWHREDEQALACQLNGEGAPSLWMAFNPTGQQTVFVLPPGEWQVEIATAWPPAENGEVHRGQVDVPAGTVLVLSAVEGD